MLSKRLVTLRTDVPVTLELEALRRGEPERARTHALFTELEFTALAKEYAPEPTPTTTAAELITTEARLREVVEAAVSAGRVAMSWSAPRARPCAPASSAWRWPPRKGRPPTCPWPFALGGPAASSTPAVLSSPRPLLGDAAVGKLSARGKVDRVVLGEAGLDTRA